MTDSYLQRFEILITRCLWVGPQISLLIVKEPERSSEAAAFPNRGLSRQAQGMGSERCLRLT